MHGSVSGSASKASFARFAQRQLSGTKFVRGISFNHHAHAARQCQLQLVGMIASLCSVATFSVCVLRMFAFTLFGLMQNSCCIVLIAMLFLLLQ